MQLCTNKDKLIYSSSTMATQIGHNYFGTPWSLDVISYYSQHMKRKHHTDMMDVQITEKL